MKKLVFGLLFTLVSNVIFAAGEYTSTKDVAKDEILNRDFQIQGEYVDRENKSTYGTVGANIVAEGDGKFSVTVFLGGLPGEGWTKGDERLRGKALLNSAGEIIAVIEDIPTPLTIKISDGKLSTEFENVSYTFTKIERKSPTFDQKSPENAVVLFDNGKASNLFEKATVNEEDKTLWSEAWTKPFENRPYLLHVEFMTSYMPNARGQGRSNSGVYINETYECQILDSFGLDGKNNECGGFYQQAEPKINMCYPPLQWQTYDVDYTPATFGTDGKKTANAKLTVKHNGVVIHDNIELKKETPGRKSEGPAANGLYLQGHGNKVQYRNIWLKYND
jgi:hypothetical protein